MVTVRWEIVGASLLPHVYQSEVYARRAFRDLVAARIERGDSIPLELVRSEWTADDAGELVGCVGSVIVDRWPPR